jgi:hypothetical protein
LSFEELGRTETLTIWGEATMSVVNFREVRERYVVAEPNSASPEKSHRDPPISQFSIGNPQKFLPDSTHMQSGNSANAIKGNGFALAHRRIFCDCVTQRLVLVVCSSEFVSASRELRQLSDSSSTGPDRHRARNRRPLSNTL